MRKKSSSIFCQEKVLDHLMIKEGQREFFNGTSKVMFFLFLAEKSFILFTQIEIEMLKNFNLQK